jgi:Xaa-Pro aminopeptidase
MPSQNPIVIHSELYAGESVAQKLNRTARELRRSGATTTIISALDEVAWQFNLRGSDIPFNPFFKSYAIIHVNYETHLPEVFLSLTQFNRSSYTANVRLFDYSMFWSRLNATVRDSDVKKIWTSPRVSQAILESIPENKLILPLSNSPVQRVKAQKNTIERKGMRDCQIRDAVARIKHIGWIEEQLNNGRSINETELSDQLLFYQKQQDRFQFASFRSISAAGDRAAVVHYTPERETARLITKKQVYLLDVSTYRKY